MNEGVAQPIVIENISHPKGKQGFWKEKCRCHDGGSADTQADSNQQRILAIFDGKESIDQKDHACQLQDMIEVGCEITNHRMA